MKIKVALTADELMNVVDAAMVEASDRGYDPCDEEIVDDMLHIVDAALTAMGVEVIEDADTEEVDTFGVPVDYDSDFDDFDEEEEEEEEEVDPIEELIYESNGMRVISKEDADEMFHIFVSLVTADDDIPQEDKWDVAKKCFMGFCADKGIEGVDMNE